MMFKTRARGVSREKILRPTTDINCKENSTPTGSRRICRDGHTPLKRGKLLKSFESRLERSYVNGIFLIYFCIINTHTHTVVKPFVVPIFEV